MLSDEEKKAIEVLNYIKNKTPFIFWYEDKPYNRKETINTILNLIEKQQKEIAELKEINEEMGKALDEWNNGERTSIFHIHKDKIKAKIEESELLIDNSQGCMSDEDLYKEYGKIEFGQSLLEKE